jgi:hypothetical protein
MHEYDPAAAYFATRVQVFSAKYLGLLQATMLLPSRVGQPFNFNEAPDVHWALVFVQSLVPKPSSPVRGIFSCRYTVPVS